MRRATKVAPEALVNVHRHYFAMLDVEVLNYSGWEHPRVRIGAGKVILVVLVRHLQAHCIRGVLLLTEDKQ